MPWARKVEADLGGRLRIDLYPSMQLGGAPAQLYDQVRDGVVDLAWVEPSLMPGRFPRTETFELAFVPCAARAGQFQGAGRISPGSISRTSSATCARSRSPAAIAACCMPRRRSERVEDVKGMKLQPPTRLAAEAIKVLGGQPVAMPLASGADGAVRSM